MASEGPNDPGTITNVAYGTQAWANPSNAGSSNDSYATRTLSGVSDYLRATNFGFAIPSGATIDGILVEVEKRAAVQSRS